MSLSIWNRLHRHIMACIRQCIPRLQDVSGLAFVFFVSHSESTSGWLLILVCCSLAGYVALHLTCCHSSFFYGVGLTSWESGPETFFSTDPCGHSPYVTSSLTRRWGCLLWMCLALRKACFRTCNMLLKILPSALYTSPVSTDIAIEYCKSQSYFTTGGLPPIRATSPLRPTTRIFIFQLNTRGYSPYVTSSLTRGWVCSEHLPNS
jgi:hypothetical protein